MNSHKIDHFGRDQLGRANEVALVLSVLVVDNYYELAVANIFHGFGDRSKRHYKKFETLLSLYLYDISEIKPFLRAIQIGHIACF